MAKVVMYSSCTEDVASLPGVRDSVRGHGSEIFLKAQANMAAHRHSGNARIEISDTDFYPHWGVTISMIDDKAPGQGGPGALSIEAGHYVRGEDGIPRKVEGLHILGKAAGLR